MNKSVHKFFKSALPATIVAGSLFLAGCSTVSPDAAAIIADVINEAGGVLQNQAAVVVGLDYVDPDAYAGWDGACHGAVLDAQHELEFLRARGIIDIKILLNEQATQFAFLRACATQAAKLGDNGVLHIFVSGHGGQVPDIDGDEPDRLDETLCLYDGQCTDDLLGAALALIPEKRKVTFTTDSCNSGSNYRALHDYVKVFEVRTSRGYVPIKCQFLHLGGCADGKSSYGSVAGGEFTNARHATYVAAITWDTWFKAVGEAMPRNQVPVMEYLNAPFAGEIAYCPPGVSCVTGECEDPADCEDSAQ